MNLNDALTKILKENGVETVLNSNKIRAYLLDYRVDEPTISSFVSLTKSIDFSMIVKEHRNVSNWSDAIENISMITKLQPSFIKESLEVLTGCKIDVVTTSNTINCRVDGSYEDDNIYYTGQIVNGMPDGYGTIIFKKGKMYYNKGFHKYEGEVHFIDEQAVLTGYGTLYTTYGTIKGILDQGSPVGLMDCEYDDGHGFKFIGKTEFENGIIAPTKNSSGRYQIHIDALSSISDVVILDGEMKNSKVYGIASFLEPEYKGWHLDYKGDSTSNLYKITDSGARLEGEVSLNRTTGKMNNKISGKCTAYYKNGDKYVGTVKNDLRDGFGKYYTGNIVIESQWRQGSPIGEVRLLSNGIWYFGSISNNTFSGREKKLFSKKKQMTIDFQR